MEYYIASCVFTNRFPELSLKIRNYIKDHYDLEILRCCTPGWKVKIYEDQQPAGELYDSWKSLQHTTEFKPGDVAYSLCHNCTNIIEEHYPGAIGHSLWELIDKDESFVYPDYSGMKVTVQDCWRSRDRAEEQATVRSILKKMHIEFVEAEKNHAETNFCGISLYKPQVARNPKLAPKHYAENIGGLFLEHSEEEQIAIMKDYCSHYKTDTVICYCHYCLEGLKAGGVNGIHLAELLFK